MSILEPPNPQTEDISCVAATFQFLRLYWFRVLIISAALVIPCFWHRHIEACDLGSHVYNAWLVQVIQSGQAPGLWLDHRWNNVLFDFALSGLGNIFGWEIAGKLAASGAALIFFWGAFALASAMTRRTPWSVTPCLAIFTYGWIFEMGLMNCYISFGLAFFALAILVRGRGWQRGLAALFVPLIWLAHPLGLVGLAALGSYAVLVEHISLRRRFYLLGAAVFILLGIHFFIKFHFPSYSIEWGRKPYYVHDGFDQLLLFGSKYLVPARVLRVFLCICLIVDVMQKRRTPRWWAPYLLSAELYLILFISMALLPTAIDSPRLHRMGFVAIALVTERMTSVSAVLICCLLSAMKPQKWHVIGFCGIAATLFFFLYSDTGAISRTEDQLDAQLLKLSPGQRVVAAIEVFPSSNVGSAGMIGRACIGRCFYYANYEPLVSQFRVRANIDNRFVLMSRQTTSEGKFEDYTVQPKDLPLFDVNKCSSSGAELCLRELKAGDKTPIAFKLDHSWLQGFNRMAQLFDLMLAAVLAIAVSLVRSMVGRRKQVTAQDAPQTFSRM